MLWANLKIAALLFFGWLIVDSACSVFFGKPLKGVHYPVGSHRVTSSPVDWTEKKHSTAPFMLFVYGIIWVGCLIKEGRYDGARIASFVTAFLVGPMSAASYFSADIYHLTINKFWLVSMFYCSVSFLLFGLFGRSKTEFSL